LAGTRPSDVVIRDVAGLAMALRRDVRRRLAAVARPDARRLRVDRGDALILATDAARDRLRLELRLVTDVRAGIVLLSFCHA
jgi:hypothetical protein